MKPYLILLLCLLSKITSNAQLPIRSSIILHATTSVVSGEYFIYILSNDDSTRLTFMLKDSLRLTELDADTNTIKYRKILQSTKHLIPENDTVRVCLNKLDSIFQVYTVYSADSITIPNQRYLNYWQLIQEMTKTPTEKLENNDHVVLDGTWMEFTLTENGKSRKVYAHSPTATSHPLLFRFITETTSLYRDTKKNNFLTKRRTAGY